MIKTTSFALPRPHSSAPSSAKTAARHKAIKMAKTREVAQSAPVNPFASATPVPEISAARARELLQSSAPQTKKRAASSPVPSPALVSAPTPKRVVSPTPVSRPVSLSTPVPATIAPAPVFAMTTASNTTKATPKSKASNVQESPALIAEPVSTVAPRAVEAVASVSVTVVAPIKVPSAPKKAKKARVPANLAEQYGQNISKRVENGIEDVPSEEETPKKRLSRTERQARREMMNPDDDLLARLQRVHNAVPTAKPEKRPRGWRFECGRCGQTSFFQTSGALCRCGALAIKE